MDSSEIREKYINFFKNKGHKQIEPSPLVLEDDPTTLFTSSGMQQLIPFLKGEKDHPKGKKLVNSQPCLRTQDIEEVGDNRHTTFFEMLGNWSIGDYFKEDQLKLAWEFLTEELGLPKEKLWVTVFKGSKEVPKDKESYEIWKNIGIPEERIRYYGAKENWWSRSGPPDKMPEGEIGGPDSEIFFEFTKVKHDSKFGKICHPNCECGRFLEIGNSVFIQYKKAKGGKLEELPEKSVDFGGGLERLVSAANDNPDIFQIDLYRPIIKKIEKTSGKSYEEDKKQIRIIADHMRAAESLVLGGVRPENKLHGYVLRRLIRKSAITMRFLKSNLTSKDLNLGFESEVISVVEKEVDKFLNTLEKGLKEVEKIEKIDGKKAFDLYQSFGFPLEVTMELFSKKGQKLKKQEFEKEFVKHRKLSKSKSIGKFKGGLGNKSIEVVKLHTATHLLHFALRKVLGDSVRQEGSNITSKRLRFDFSFDRKLTEKEIKKVEKLINEKIKEDLAVTKTVENRDEALESGVLAFFKEKYPEEVTIYSISTVSREFCGGPHVGKTSEIGRVRIERQKKIGSNMVRVYAVVEK